MGNLLKIMMRPARLERATFWFVAKRSIQLSYGRKSARILTSTRENCQEAKSRPVSPPEGAQIGLRH